MGQGSGSTTRDLGLTIRDRLVDTYPDVEKFELVAAVLLVPTWSLAAALPSGSR